MKIWKLIGTFLSALWLSACTTEEIINTPDTSEGATTLIAVSMDDLLPVNMNSRAGSINSLLSEMKDLNIRVHKNGGGYTSIYCKEGEIYVDGKNVNSAKTYYIDNNNLSSKEVQVHCNDISAKHVETVEVIANWGSDLHNKTNDWSTLKEDGDSKLQEGYCVMYGKTTIPINNDHDNSIGALDCRKFEVKLNRTRAMLSVKIDGAGLREGVTITPTKVMLKNIPTSCLVTQDNKISDKGKDVEYSLSDLGWNGSITKGGSIGVHADSGESGMPDDFRPMYLFENKQGVTSNNDQVKKWPQNCNSVEAAKANKTHSYIEIEADYKYEAGGQLKNSGTIVYRFFLGGNITNDFNVNKNTYYRLTLALKNFGGAKEDGNVDDSGNLIVNENDVSWRVDLNVRDWGFEKDAYDFDAHGTLGVMKVMGSGWQVLGSGTTGAESFIKFWSADNALGWVEPTNVGNCKTQNGNLYFFIQPWAWDGSGTDGFYVDNDVNDPNNSNRRKMEITLSNGSQTQTVTFYQWKPITLVNGKIYMERFEEDNPYEWGYQNEKINYSTTLSNKRMWEAFNNMPNSPAQLYCKEKNGYASIPNSKKEEYGLTSSPSGNEATYCLPDWNTLELMKKYCEDNPYSNDRDNENYYQPLDFSSEGGYWSVSTNVLQTYFMNANGQQGLTAERNSKKKVRAVYLINPW